MVDIVRTRRSFSDGAVPTALENGQLGVTASPNGDRKVWMGDTGNVPLMIYDSTDSSNTHTHAQSAIINLLTDQAVQDTDILQNATDITTVSDSLVAHTGSNADAHPQAAITGLVADQNTQNTNISTNTTNIATNTGDILTVSNDLAAHLIAAIGAHAATAISYINATSGLSATEVQAAIDEVAASNAAGIVEYGAIAIEVVADEGISASVDQMDWTGHQAAVGRNLRIELNHIVTFSNGDGKTYRWVGIKPMDVGIDAAGTVSADYLSTGTSDHDALINAGVIRHVDIDSHINDITGNPHAVTAAQTGASPTGHNHDGIYLKDVADDLNPALGGDLVAGTNNILFSSDYGLATSGGNKLLMTQDLGNSVNYLNIIGGAVGYGPQFYAEGADADIDFLLAAKGTGKLEIFNTDLYVNGGDITLTGIVDGRDIAVDGTNQDAHIANASNPHAVTLSQLNHATTQHILDCGTF